MYTTMKNREQIYIKKKQIKLIVFMESKSIYFLCYKQKALLRSAEEKSLTNE